MSILKIENNQIYIEPQQKFPKKITGTRFAAILGKNSWTTPFATWCDITHTYEEPYEDTIYTLAGKAIEPIQINYIRNHYCYGNDFISPSQVYGENFFSTLKGDFYPDVPIFGGMWDSLLLKNNIDISRVFEFKTTKRYWDWKIEPPEYYALQVSLYSYLLHIDAATLVASFLQESDYQNPELFIPNEFNTKRFDFNIYEKFPDFNDLIDEAKNFWNVYVLGNISPPFDKQKDKKILEALGIYDQV